MRILGFPLHVRPGFLLFMLLIVAVNADEFGVWLAISIAGFTLLHELGHAVAARRAGAQAEISLDFLAGYASYHSPQPLSRTAQVMISLAGPVTHIVVSLGVLLAMGVDPFDPYSRGSSPAATAVWWAGPAIGAFNLLPVLPLDGGNVVTSLLDRVLPGRARPLMLYASVAVSVVAAVVCALSPGWRGMVVFIGFLLIMQLQSLFAHRARHARSPFDVAVDALDDGDAERARRVLVNGLRRPAAVPLVPHPMSDEAAARLVDLLPRPLPDGDPWNEYVLANLLRAGGPVRRGRPLRRRQLHPPAAHVDRRHGGSRRRRAGRRTDGRGMAAGGGRRRHIGGRVGIRDRPGPRAGDRAPPPRHHRPAPRARDPALSPGRRPR